MLRESGCSICDDPGGTENPIVKCTGCNVRTHIYCVGAEGKNENWMCSPCRSGKRKIASCRLCFYKGGVMKETLCKGWVHVICALFTDGVSFQNLVTMEPVDVSKVSQTKRNKLCIFCYKRQGYCCLCSNPKCNDRIHISCAQKENCLKEVENEIDGTIKFRAYCRTHKPKPPKSGRRVSSGCVKGILNKKRQKQLTASGLKTNGDWILNSLQTSAENLDTAIVADIVDFTKSPNQTDAATKFNSEESQILSSTNVIVSKTPRKSEKKSVLNMEKNADSATSDSNAPKMSDAVININSNKRNALDFVDVDLAVPRKKKKKKSKNKGKNERLF